MDMSLKGEGIVKRLAEMGLLDDMSDSDEDEDEDTEDD